jgi:hypothetical protein
MMRIALPDGGGGGFEVVGGVGVVVPLEQLVERFST